MTGEARPRLPLVALGCAVLAVTVSVVAAVIVLTRDDERPVALAPATPALLDQRVSAADVMKLAGEIEVVVDAGMPRGVRVKDAALAQALGLRADDVLTSMSGRALKGASDVSDVTFRGATSGVTMLYVELDRGAARTLVRWQLDGSLLDARRDQVRATPQAGGTVSPFGPGPGSGGGVGSGGSLDPFVDHIEKLDDTHSRVSRASLERLLANATQLSRGCRIVPSLESGKPDGYKLYAIRPSSVFARLGFENGDTVHSINGAPLADVDDLVSLLVDAKRKVPAFAFELTRRGQPVTVHVEITR